MRNFAKPPFPLHSLLLDRARTELYMGTCKRALADIKQRIRSVYIPLSENNCQLNEQFVQDNCVL